MPIVRKLAVVRRFQIAIVVSLLAGWVSSVSGAQAQPSLDPAVPGTSVTTSGRFGAVESYAAPEAARRAGVRWQRINFWWNTLQPDNTDDWDWSGLPITDSALDADLAAGIKVVGLLGNPPAWATRDGSVPRNLTLPPVHAANYWATFVRALAARYAGRIDYWIVWNEPDIDPGQLGSTWSGTEDEYYYLLKTASLAAKSVNPAAQIVFAGTTYFSDFNVGRKLFLERILTVAGYRDPAAAANGYYFDAVDLHIYSSPYEMENISRQIADILIRFGLSKPIWISEMNVVPFDDPYANLPRGGYRATLDEQASFIIQAFALATAAGIERVAVYKMKDGFIERSEPYGLVRNDGSARPAFAAFQVAEKYLDQPARVLHRFDDSVHYVTFDRPSSRVTVLWNGSPSPASGRVEPVGGRAKIVDKLGNETVLNPRQSAYQIPLAPATANSDDSRPNVYLIGGDPVLVVEDGYDASLADAGNTVFFPATGYHVSGVFLDYFGKRGGLRTFGLPISRRFILLGSEVQFFQRQVMQVRPDGTAGTINILDTDLMPYTRVNGAVLPGIEKPLQDAAPLPGIQNYPTKALQFVADRVPNAWLLQPVNFLQTFNSTVKPEEAFPSGRHDSNLLPGINLELWGMPTSQPARDPANDNFVFQRFQRGVMHYDRRTGATQGVLLAFYFRSIITGRELPDDLASQASASRFYLQYDNNKPNGLSRPFQLPGTNLRDAFERESYGRLPILQRP